jgi:transcriptional regulator with XRE-family HTH domain
MIVPASNKRHRELQSAAATALASNCRRLREERGWTQGELAAAMQDTKQPDISFIENGRANPSLLFLENLATALGVKLEMLFRTPPPKRNKKTK